MAPVISRSRPQFSYLFKRSVINSSVPGGQHQSTNERSQQIAYAAPLPAPLCASSAKFSILCLYNRIFSRNKQLRAWIVLVFVLCVIWTIVITAIFILRCIPIEKQWNIFISGHCIDFIPFLMGAEIPLLAVDLAVIILPIKAICNLQLPLQTKLGLCFIFTLGGL